MPRPTLLRTLRGLVAVGLILGAWLLVGPKQLGGPLTYAVIDGNSMEPMLHAEDAAVVREKSSYEVGDVVAYRSAELDRLVLHRIIEQDGDRFVLQGDNNDFVDSAQPTSEQIAGELALSVPKVGAVIERLRSSAGLGLMLALAGVFAVRHVRRRRQRAASEKGAGRAVGPGGSQPAAAASPDDRSARAEQLQSAIGIAGGAAIVLAVVAAIAFSRPTVETVVAPDLYEQVGTFSYAAEVADSPAYDSTVAADGQAIFTALANAIDVGFDYRLTSEAPHALAGRASLVATLTDGKGLERHLPVAEPREFAGDSVSLDGTLRLRGLESLIRGIEATTGASSDSYFITLRPLVEVSGRVGSAPIVDSFAPELVFRLDATRLSLAQTSAIDDEANALVRTQLGSGSESVAATFGVFGLEPSVSDVRGVALLGALLAAAVFVAALLLARRARRDEDSDAATDHPQAAEAPPSPRPTLTKDELTGLVQLADLLGGRDGSSTDTASHNGPVPERSRQILVRRPVRPRDAA